MVCAAGLPENRARNDLLLVPCTNAASRAAQRALAAAQSAPTGVRKSAPR